MENLLSLFGDLMSHLNSEENEMAISFRGLLEEVEGELDFLNALHAAGVDNWEGYSIAHQMMRDED